MDLIWKDISSWGVEGKGWQDTERYYDRLPLRARDKVRGPVWNLSRHATGMCAHFITDSPSIHARWRVESSNLALVHMPSTSVSGLDLYAALPNGVWHWTGAGRPTEGSTEFTATLVENVAPGERLYRLYLPLFNPVLSVEIGVENGASFRPIPPRSEKPVVFYGTSIVHGGCASRPGMSHVAILGRRLGVPVINLGFSGQGTMDLSMGELLTELDAAVFVIDCLPNLIDAQLVTERTIPLIRVLRSAHPSTPIVLVEDRTFSSAPLLPECSHMHVLRRAALQAAFDTLVQEGDQNLYYVKGETLLGTDGEGTVDGSHPTDLGFMRMTDALTPVLAQFV